jgi:hypothetical protein
LPDFGIALARRYDDPMATQTRQEVEVTAEPMAVRRTLMRIETRSVLKFSVLFSVTCSLVLLLAGGILYLILVRTGFVVSLQTIINNAGFPRFRLRARAVFEILAVLTLAGAIAWTAVIVLAAVLFNLVADAAGGIDITLKE